MSNEPAQALGDDAAEDTLVASARWKWVYAGVLGHLALWIAFLWGLTRWLGSAP